MIFDWGRERRKRRDTNSTNYHEREIDHKEHKERREERGWTSAWYELRTREKGKTIEPRMARMGTDSEEPHTKDAKGARGEGEREEWEG